ncbi:hypothetical protein BC937DRAFT_92233 [Endogone sp. FLAS-F59071]|nr:hypothetical protein BC937DRAFT_92233 [Endogone sp. FLAS-F59071]|eukprot:RUS15614.1 hypothetical protein BC937DRAFT_92233 [Endogone sp. FLAS-F59071]
MANSKIKLGGFLVVGDLLIAHWRSNRNERSPYRVIKQGSNLDPSVNENQFIDRKDIPSCGHSFFHTIVGEEGIGKTVAVRQAASEIGKGVVYVKIPEDLNSFGDEFAKALKWRFETTTVMAAIGRMILGTHSGIVLSPSEKINRALEAFDRGAKQYKATYGVTPVLILDNVSKLSREDPQLLKILQDYAKDRAAQSKHSVVFVSNKGIIPHMTMTHSSKTMNFEDFDETEALQYLKKLDIEEKYAKQLYGLFGGRIGHLRMYGDDLKKGMKFEDIRKVAFSAIEGNFCQAKMLKGGENYKVGRCIIKKLLKDKKISLSYCNRLLGNEAIMDELLRANVISFDPADRTISFQSRLAEVYAKEKI